MNQVQLVGNLTRDPEMRTTASGTAVASFSVAVTRNFKSQDGTYETDFINCVAWRSQADFVSRWFKKGKAIGIVGRLQTRSYDDKTGQRRYVTEVVADHVEFVGNKSGDYSGGSSQGGGYQQRPAASQQPQAAPVAPAPAASDPIFTDDIDMSDDSFEPLVEADLPF